MPGFWTPTLRKDFHQAVEELYAKTQNPSPEGSYYESLAEGGDNKYTLRLGDELQLANHIAFLAHSQEGVYAISGASVEECGNGLTIRLASNRTPSLDTVCKLRGILNTASRGAIQRTSRTALQEIIFADVLNLSQERILQRIRPRWARAPIYFPGSEKSLLNRMEPFCSSFKSSPGFPLCLLSRLDSLLSSLRLLETIERSDEHSILVAITSIVRHCADVAYSKDHRSLEQQLRQIQIPNSEEILKSREVAQIDKLARYFGLSKDLANLARRSEYYHVTQNFSLEYITAYQASQPAGALRKCHVHAEVQLILHYEQHPLDKPPRVIGCSKSACFLCDLLIKMTGQYYISHAHRRLYNQWTIPDVPWMTMERVNYFRAILGGMIIKMGSLLENERRNNTNSQKQTFRPFGLESRAGLILSSNSDLSLSTLPSRLASSLPISCIPLNLLPQSIENKAKIVPVDSIKVGSTSRLSLVNLRRDDLPHQQPLNPNTGTLCLELDALTIIFECSSVSDGKLCIREIEEGARAKEDGARCIQVSDLTTDSITLRDRTNPSTLRFWLRISHSIAIEIEICWVVLK